MKYKFLVSTIFVLTFLFGYAEAQIKKLNNSKIDLGQAIIESVTIGTQVWMKKNLDVDHYRNGDPIPQVTDSTAWVNYTSGAWCYYNNDPANGAKYGKLYNWYATNDPRGLAPPGWRVASNEEWSTLVSATAPANGNGSLYSGIKLKEAGTSHWTSPNTGASNESGFTALPGGYKSYPGTNFDGIGTVGYWWTSSETGGTIYAYRRELYSTSTMTMANHINKSVGCSVRCIKD
ncbi:MAG: fibrobacter succinogenes major paralogous domain-containing protein [Bacteroidota bacterium]